MLVSADVVARRLRPPDPLKGMLVAPQRQPLMPPLLKADGGYWYAVDSRIATSQDISKSAKHAPRTIKLRWHNMSEGS